MSRGGAPWPERRIDELCHSIVDCVNRTAPVVDSPTPYRMIRTTNVRNGFVDVSDTRFVEENVYRTWTRRQVPVPGDVILTREAPLGDVGIIRPGHQVFLGQRLVSYRTDPDLLDNRYLLYYLLSEEGKSQVLKFGMGSTVAHMRVPDAKKLKIPTPPIETQRRIASILVAYDDLIEVNRRRVAALEIMARALFEEWFVRFRFPGHESPPLLDTPDGPLPKGWSVCPFGDFFDLTIGGLWGEAEATSDADQQVAVIRGTDFPRLLAGRFDSVPTRFANAKDLSKRKIMRGDLILEASGGSKDQPVGRALFVSNSLIEALGTVAAPASFCRLLRPKPQTGLAEYTHGLLRMMYDDRRIEKFQKQSTGLRNLSMKQLAAEPMVRPHDMVLRSFGHKVRPMIDAMSIHRNEIRSLAASRDLLLPRLISGRLSLDSAECHLEMAA